MKKIIKAVLIIMAVITLTTGCTPKTNKLWVENNDVKFSLDYKAFDVVFDGVRSSFSVKDKDDFEKTIKKLSSYVADMKLIDEDLLAHVFEVQGEVFYIFNSKDNQYTMSPSIVVQFNGNGTESKCIAPPMKKFQYGKDESIKNKRNWQYFVDFYSTTDADIDENLKKIVVKQGSKTTTFTVFDDRIEMNFNY